MQLWRAMCFNRSILHFDKAVKMLQPVLEYLNTKRIILASGSPRRQELIKQLGLKVELCPSSFEENLKPSDFKRFEEFVQETAHGKVQEVFRRLSEQNAAPDFVIGADTMVTLDGMLYGKPTSEQEAFDTLTKLSGRPNIVYTGVVIKTKTKTVKFCESTKVYFGKLSPEVIKAYLATGEPMDKAGSYGVQGLGASLIERFEGDYYTVVGLPLYRLCVELNKLCEDDFLNQ